MIGLRCTRDTFCQTIAKTSANDLLDKCKFCQNGQIIIIIIHNILRGGLQSPRGGFQEGPLRK